MPIFSVPEIAQTAETIATRLRTIANTTGPLNPDVLKELDDLHNSAQSLFHATSPAAVRATIAKINELALSIIPVLSVLPLPPPAGLILRAVGLLLPVLQHAGDLLFPDEPEPEVSGPKAFTAESYFYANAEVIKASDGPR